MQLKAIERSIKNLEKLVAECTPQAPAYNTKALAARIQALNIGNIRPMLSTWQGGTTCPEAHASRAEQSHL